jgi:ribosomal protein L37AE/L43A
MKKKKCCDKPDIVKINHGSDNDHWCRNCDALFLGSMYNVYVPIAKATTEVNVK